ncbi:MAG: hypothetical protein AB1898_15000 [Acidobacteriota bacterium]
MMPCLSPSGFRIAAAAVMTGLIFFSTNVTAQIRGPVLGYVFDPVQQGLRPIWGIPGAAHLGELVEVGVRLDSLQVSPNHEYGLGLAVGKSSLLAIDLRNGPALARIREIEEVDSAAPRIVYSSQGTAVAVFRSDRDALEVLIGLPGSIRIVLEAELPFPASELQAAALSNDGTTLLLAATEGAASRLYAVGGEAGSRPIALLGKVTSLLILDSNHDGVVADAARDEVYLLRDFTGTAQPIPLAGPSEGISQPVSLGLSRDNRRVFVANAASGAVTMLDFEGGAPVTTPCRCTPTVLQPLDGDSIFRLTDLSDTPLWIVDGALSENRILFVPTDFRQRSSRTRVSQRLERGAFTVPRRVVR